MLPPHYCAVLAAEGPSLEAALHGSVPPWRPTWAQRLALAAGLARAVAGVHGAGWVHRCALRG